MCTLYVAAARIRQKDLMRLNIKFCPGQMVIDSNGAGVRPGLWVPWGAEKHLADPDGKAIATHNGNSRGWQNDKSDHEKTTCHSRALLICLPPRSVAVEVAVCLPITILPLFE